MQQVREFVLELRRNKRLPDIFGRKTKAAKSKIVLISFFVNYTFFKIFVTSGIKIQNCMGCIGSCIARD
jgi:hypothetical protein